MDFFSFDAEYVQRLRSRDSWTEEHFTRYFRLFLTLKFRGRGIPPSDVDDILQEVFARTLGRISDIEDPRRFAAYVNNTANETLLDYYGTDGRSTLLESSARDAPDEASDDETRTGLVIPIKKMPILRTFGSIVSPADGVFPPVDQIVPHLTLPADRQSRLLAAENMPLAVLRQVANNPRVMHQMSPRMFEEFIAELLGD